MDFPGFSEGTGLDAGWKSVYYQGRDGGKPPSLHYTPLKHEGSKTLSCFLSSHLKHYTPLKHEGSKTSE